MCVIECCDIYQYWWDMSFFSYNLLWNESYKLKFIIVNLVVWWIYCFTSINYLLMFGFTLKMYIS